VRKPDAGQVFQAISFLICACLAFQITSGLDGTEFSGGRLTGPLLSMANGGTVLFAFALLVTFLLPRIAAGIGLVSSLLSVPLCAFLIAPVPFAQVFDHGHEFKFQPTPGFHWQSWPVATLFAVALACYLCIRRLATGGQMRRASLA
jgi:hypothetical protein